MIWVPLSTNHDYRTDPHRTLKKMGDALEVTMRYQPMPEFVSCYNPQDRPKRKATEDEKDTTEGRSRSYSYEEARVRDEASLGIFWLNDKNLMDLNNLNAPDDLAEEIIENLEASSNSLREVLAGFR